MLLPPAVRLMRGNRAAFASPIAVECRSDAALGGDHVRSALEQLRRHAYGYRCGHRRKLLRDRDLRRGVASNEQFERPQRLLARQIDLAQHVVIGAGAGARFRYRLLVAVADAQSLLRDLQQRLGRMQRIDDDLRAAIPLRWPRTRPLPPSPQVTGGHTRSRPARRRIAPLPRQWRSAGDPTRRVRGTR